jgi:hypothetical protein
LKCFEIVLQSRMTLLSHRKCFAIANQSRSQSLRNRFAVTLGALLNHSLPLPTPPAILKPYRYTDPHTTFLFSPSPPSPPLHRYHHHRHHHGHLSSWLLHQICSLFFTRPATALTRAANLGGVRDIQVDDISGWGRLETYVKAYHALLLSVMPSQQEGDVILTCRFCEIVLFLCCI